MPEEMPEGRKIIQIASLQIYFGSALVALCDDGSVWIAQNVAPPYGQKWVWTPFVELPTTQK
jgi:hypothetical protein